MALTNGYCSIAEFKGHVMTAGSNVTWQANDDTNIEIAINAISRLIDELNDTNFYGATETRYFTADWHDLMYIDDLISITTLKTDTVSDGTYDTTWATTDYVLEPRNARVKANAEDRKPYRQIRIDKNGNYTFPTDEYGVEIAGVWGYTTSTPHFVKQAVLLAAHRIWKRKDAIFGVAGAPALGVQVIRARIQQDSDLMLLLQGISGRGW